MAMQHLACAVEPQAVVPVLNRILELALAGAVRHLRDHIAAEEVHRSEISTMKRRSQPGAAWRPHRQRGTRLPTPWPR